MNEQKEQQQISRTDEKRTDFTNANGVPSASTPATLTACVADGPGVVNSTTRRRSMKGDGVRPVVSRQTRVRMGKHRSAKRRDDRMKRYHIQQIERESERESERECVCVCERGRE